MKKNIKNKVASGLVLASALTAVAVMPLSARADDSSKSALDDAISIIDTLSPKSFTSRGFVDGHGNYQNQDVLSFNAGKAVYRGETGSNVYGLDLNLGKINSDLDGFRFNIGYQDFIGRGSSDSNSRLMIEKSFENNPLNFLNIEIQDNAGEEQVASSAGLSFGKFKPQFTLDDEGDFGYALIFNATENGGIGFGGHKVNDLDVFNTAFSYKWSDENSFLDGYKIACQAKIFDTANSSSGLEVRVRFGEKASGGAFLVGVQDALFNNVTPFLGGDGDATSTFGIGDGDSRFDFYGAANHNSGKAGAFSFDFKYHDESSSRYFKGDVAVGLGSVSDSFLEDCVLQTGRYLDLNDSSNNVSNVDFRTKFLSGDKDSWSFDFALRAAVPDTGENAYSAMLGFTYNF